MITLRIDGRNLTAREDETILEGRVGRHRQRGHQLEQLTRPNAKHAGLLGFLSLVERSVVHEQVRDVADRNTRNHDVQVLETRQQRRHVRAHR